MMESHVQQYSICSYAAMGVEDIYLSTSISRPLNCLGFELGLS